MKEAEIVLSMDGSCDMEKLEVNGVTIGFGNTHDNHCEDRFDAITKTLKLLKIPHKAKVDRNWKY